MTLPRPAGLLRERLVNSDVGCIGSDCFVRKLGVACGGHPHDDSEAGQREDEGYDPNRLFRAHTYLLKVKGVTDYVGSTVIEVRYLLERFSRVAKRRCPPLI